VKLFVEFAGSIFRVFRIAHFFAFLLTSLARMASRVRGRDQRKGSLSEKQKPRDSLSRLISLIVALFNAA